MEYNTDMSGIGVEVQNLMLGSDTINQTTGNNRFLLYIDILGFKKLVEEKTVEEVYKVVDDALKLYYELEKQKNNFSVIYFSDTILIYQKDEEDTSVAYAETWLISRLIYCNLLSKGIPIRAIITFGEFVVKQDSYNRNSVFFGKALVKAYETEKNENWIGIIVTKGSYLFEENEYYKIEHDAGNFLRRNDGCLMINPFIQIRNCSKYYKSFSEIGPSKMKDSLEIELMAFSFIYNEANKFSFETFCDRVAEKYLNTLLFIKEVMKDDMFNWAERNAKDLRLI